MWNAGGAFQQIIGEHRIRVNARYYNNKAGVFYGIQNSTIDSFQAQIDRARPILADVWKQDRDIDKAYQEVGHLLTSAHWDFPLFNWFDTEVIYAFQRNDRIR